MNREYTAKGSAAREFLPKHQNGLDKKDDDVSAAIGAQKPSLQMISQQIDSKISREISQLNGMTMREVSRIFREIETGHGSTRGMILDHVNKLVRSLSVLRTDQERLKREVVDESIFLFFQSQMDERCRRLEQEVAGHRSALEPLDRHRVLASSRPTG